MSIFNKLKNKISFSKDNNIINEDKTIKENLNLNLTEINNYMLSDIRKDNLDKNCYSLSISKLNEISPLTIPIADSIKTIISQNSNSSEKLYRITNLGMNDSLKAMKDGKTFWGAIRKNDGTSAMAKLTEVNSKSVVSFDPTMMMMSVALAGIEAELVEIKELNKKIFLFLEEEKESEIESDLEILNRSIIDFKYNIDDDKYLINNHKQVMDIKRTANKNMLFYKKQIKDDLLKNKIITTTGSMNSIINDVEKKLKYYRLSLYIYSFSSLIEILLLGNYQEEYLFSKKEELDKLDEEYSKIFNETFDYIKNNANKSLEGNFLSGLGSAGKAIGSLAEKTKVKNIDVWINEKSENLKKTGQSIKDNYIAKFDELKNSNSKFFANQIEKMNCIYNKTKEIYFDSEKIYLEIN